MLTLTDRQKPKVENLLRRVRGALLHGDKNIWLKSAPSRGVRAVLRKRVRQELYPARIEFCRNNVEIIIKDNENRG